MAKDIVEYKAKDGQLINLNTETVRKFLIRGNNQAATNQEIIFFMGICKSRGLNPFKNDCYLIKYGNDPAAIIMSIDYFRARAKSQPDCAGWQKGIIVKKKETGEIIQTKGLLDKENEILLGGWFSAQPKGWNQPFELEVNLFNYIKKTKDGRITRFWSEENQPTQIAKVAESQGLRTCWPDEFQGIYLEAEIIHEEIEQPKKPKIHKEIYQAKTVPKILEKESEEKTESSNDNIDDQNKILIASFSKLNKEPLQKFEETHRDKIPLWPEDVRIAFLLKWKTKMKISYDTFLRRTNLINGEEEKTQSSENSDSQGLGIIRCPTTNEHITLNTCIKACELYKKQECLARFPE